MEAAATLEEFPLSLVQGVKGPQTITGLTSPVPVPENCLRKRCLEAKRRKGPSHRRRRKSALVFLFLLLFLLANRWEEANRLARQCVQHFPPVKIARGSPTQGGRQVISLQECVPPPCVDNVDYLNQSRWLLFEFILAC